MDNKKILNLIEKIKAQQSMKTVAQVSTGSITLKNTSLEGRSSGSTGVIDTKTVSVGNYLYLDSYNQDGGMFESPILGYYNGEVYALFGYVDMDALLAENNLPLGNLTDCYLTIYGVSGNFTSAYSIYDANEDFVGYSYGNGTEVYVPLKAIYDSCGRWEFALVPTTGYDGLYFSGEADAQISYSYYPTIEVNRSENVHAGGYVNLISVDEQGNILPWLYLGEYNNMMYGIAVSVNMEGLLSFNNIPMENINNYILTLNTVSGNMYGWYEIISESGMSVITGECSGNKANIPLKDIYDACGSWNFIIVPRSYQTGVQISNSVYVGISYTEELGMTGIEISSPPTKTNYIEGETLNLSGMVVKAICVDGTKAPITDYTIIPMGKLKTTDTSFSVLYKGYSAQCAINVLGMMISVNQAPIKTKYLEGDKFDPMGMVVTVTYSNGRSKAVTNYTYSTNILTSGTTSVTISYTESGVTKTTTQAITVTAPGKEGYFGNKNVSGSTYGNNPTFNLATMGMKYVESGLAIGVNSYAIGVNLVYDSQMKSKLQDMCKGMPKDWKLDAHQFVVKDGKDDNNVDTYKYIDGQGYVHTFEFYDAAYNKYYDTGGAGLTLVKNTSGYQIYDESNNAMTFNADGRLTQVSMPSKESVKSYVYENGYLKRIYDNRKSSRKIELSYGNNQLVISSYDGSTQKETLICSYGNNKELVSISKMVTGTSKTLKKFTYDIYKKLSLIQDVITGDGIKITQNFNTLFNEYTVYQFEYGYIRNDVFQEKSFARFGEYNVQTSDYKTLREVKCLTSKGVKTSFMLNSKGLVVNTFECNQNTYYKSLSLQAGKDLVVSGDLTTELINSYGKSSLASGAIEFSKIVESTELDACKHLALKFRLKLKELTQRAYVYIIVTTDTSSIISKKTMIDASAYESWQDVYVPFTREMDRIRKFRVILVDYSDDALEAEVCNFYLVKQDKTTLYLNNGNQSIDFKDITKVKFYSGPNILTEEVNIKTDENLYMTENDVLRTLRKINAPKTEPYVNFEVYFNNGVKRKMGEFALKLETADGKACYLVGTEVATCYTETVSADGKTTTRTDYAFDSTQMTRTTKITAGGKESTTAKVVDYYGRTQSETDAYGVVTTCEYHTDGSLKKQTMTNDNQSMVVYENTQSASEDGKYDILTDKSFDLGEKYTYHNLFGTLDKVEKVCYNGITETVYNTTNYAYDSYHEQLLSVSATADNQTHTNTMTYESGELSIVTDNQVKYGFDLNKVNNTVTFGVYDGTTFANLEKVSGNNTSNTVTHEYYRTDSATVSDTIKKQYDSYGLPIREYNDNTEKVTYYYYATGASEATRQLSRIVDGYTGTTLKHYYDDKGAIEKVQKLNTATNTVLLEVEKVSTNEIHYSFSTEGATYKTQKITNVDNPVSTRAENTKVYEGSIEKEILSWVYTYDKFGRLESKTNKNGSWWDGNYVYEYNSDSTISGIDYHGSYMFNNEYLLITTSCKYDKGQITKITETTTLSGQATTRVQNYTYDNHGRLKTAKIVTDGTTETDNQYTYDNNGRLTQIYLAHNGLYRTQGYDDRGRIISSYLNTTANDELWKSYRYTYDNYGNRVTKSYYYQHYELHNYTWERGRLLEKIEDGNGSVVGQYTYDLNGVRYTKTADGVTTTYFYNGNTLLGENKSNGTRLRYFYDATGLCGFSYYNGSTTKYYTYVKDVLGNIVMIKDDMGLPLVRYMYNEWGVCTMTALNLDGGAANALETEIGNINPFRYRGYYYDSESGLYYLMSRYYDPAIGQFISPDTQDYLAPDIIGGVDLYAYGLNNPVMYVDPTGHFPWLILAAVLLFTPVGGTALQVATSALSYAGMAVASIFNEDIRNDMNAIGWNPFNTDESATLNSSKVSFYKGVPVFQISGMGGSMSLGAIFLDKKQGVEVLKHERGHNTQLMSMGLGNYLIQIAIPSVWKNGDETPWELSASMLGGSALANGYTKEQKRRAYNYYLRACFPIVNIYNIFQYIFYK